MKALAPRGPAPGQFADAEVLRTWYARLEAGGEVASHWLKGKEHPVQQALLAISGGSCAWCGSRLDLGNVQVDHLLPVSKFPMLAYCWANLLPACQECNRRKADYCPPALPAGAYRDPVLGSEDPYVPSRVLPPLEERLVEPTIEDPTAHLTFKPESHGYVPKSRVGEVTRQRFFDEKTDATRLEGLSRLVKLLIGLPTEATLLANLKAVFGRDFYVDAYAAYWRSFLG